MPHRSRLCHFVIDCDDLDEAVRFWAEALDATDEPLPESSRSVYRRLRLPDSEIRVLLQRTDDAKASKERMHLDIETDDVDAEVERLKALGASPWDHQQERGHDFWVMRDPWGNEFCILPPEFPGLLARRRPWPGKLATAPHAFPISVKGVVFRGERVLLLRNERDEWELPGGKLDLGEDPAICVVREIAEEVGWDVTVGPILDAWQYPIRRGIDVLIITYGCHLTSGGDPMVSDEHKEAGMFTLDEVTSLPMPEGYRRSIRAWHAVAGELSR